jgi:aminotransferase
MAFDADYYNHLALEYRARRDMMCLALDEAGFKYAAPEGAYYILADFSEISDLESREFAIWLAKEVGVATVPGMSFYSQRELGRSVTRFAFCKKIETLTMAADRLTSLPARV